MAVGPAKSLSRLRWRSGAVGTMAMPPGPSWAASRRGGWRTGRGANRHRVAWQTVGMASAAAEVGAWRCSWLAWYRRCVVRLSAGGLLACFFLEWTPGAKADARRACAIRNIQEDVPCQPPRLHLLHPGCCRSRLCLRCRSDSASVHRQWQRVFPHLDRQFPAAGADPGAVHALGAGAQAALYVRQHRGAGCAAGFSWRPAQDVPGACLHFGAVHVSTRRQPMLRRWPG